MEVDVCYSAIKITNKQNKVQLNKAFNLLKAFFYVSLLALIVEIVLKSIYAKRGRPPLTSADFSPVHHHFLEKKGKTPGLNSRTSGLSPPALRSKGLEYICDI